MDQRTLPSRSESNDFHDHDERLQYFHNLAWQASQQMSIEGQPPNTSAEQQGNFPPTLPTHGNHSQSLQYAIAMDQARQLSTEEWQFAMQQQGSTAFQQGASAPEQYNSSYQTSMQQSAPGFLPNTQQTMDANAMYIPYSAPMQPVNPLAYYHTDLQNGLMGYPLEQQMVSGAFNQSGMLSSSPAEDVLERSSISSSSEEGWPVEVVDFPHSRQSFESPPIHPQSLPRSLESLQAQSEPLAISNPGLTLHIRTNSDSSQTSDCAMSTASYSSFEHIPPLSPQSDTNFDFDGPRKLTTKVAPKNTSCSHGSSPKSNSHYSGSSRDTSPSPATSAAASSRRQKSPSSKNTKATIKKPSSTSKREKTDEKRIGRRRGPLRPEQRKSAGEIRKLRACLRCKFLKKTCDKGDPCAGCQPSHARLWQVPCTRIDIKDIGYFLKDWRRDYERHVKLSFSIANIKGYAPSERPMWITHGFGVALPMQAREVYVHDQDCFVVDWIENRSELPTHYEHQTSNLTAGCDGLPTTMLSEYLDRHIDGCFEYFVDSLFEGVPFVTEMLKIAYRYYLRTKLPSVRRALKLVLAYNLTLRITFVEGLSDEEVMQGKVNDETSTFFGKTLAPCMINFHVKTTLARLWRELHKEVLEDLSSLYSSVYSGDKLKNWPTIFILVSMILVVWEEMQFDAHYRSLDSEKVSADNFCQEMELTPVGVLVGLFSAISQKVPTFQEWDTRKHHQVLNSVPAVCDTMEEVRDSVNRNDEYLKSRHTAAFDYYDFDSLSNKFTAKLVIRAN